LFYLSKLFSTPSLTPLRGLSAFLPRRLLPEVSELDASPTGHAAEGGRLDVPVLHGVGEQADASVQVLLPTGRDGAEVVDSHAADFVAVEINHLNRQERIYFNYFVSFYVRLLPWKLWITTFRRGEKT